MINVIQEENVPLISAIRDIFLEEIIAQIKSYFPNSDLNLFKIFLPNIIDVIGETFTYGTVEISSLCTLFKIDDCLNLVSDWSGQLAAQRLSVVFQS